MKLQFLCANHRHWLQQNSYAAYSTWANAYDRADELMAEGNHQEALGYAGCAFEAAALATTGQQEVTANEIESFTETSVMLVSLLIRRGEDGYANQVLRGAITVVEDLFVSTTSAHINTRCWHRLSTLSRELVAGKTPNRTVSGLHRVH